MKVWIVGGWFGDNEWIESVWATEEGATMEIARLYEDRSSENGPEYARGLHKFGAEEYEVRSL